MGQADSDLENVQRTIVSSVIRTTPDPTWILKKVRSSPSGHIGRVSKSTGTGSKHVRYLRVYEGWQSPDFKQNGVKIQYDDYFSIMLPDNVYKEYVEKRRGYGQVAVDRLAEAFEREQNKNKTQTKGSYKFEAPNLSEEMRDKWKTILKTNMKKAEI